jgi:hypothetical protein
MDEADPNQMVVPGIFLLACWQEEGHDQERSDKSDAE